MSNIDKQYLTHCGKCVIERDDRDQEFKCAHTDCQAIGCSECMSACGFYPHCTGRFCSNHLVEFDDTEACIGCVSLSLKDEALLAQLDGFDPATLAGSQEVQAHAS